MRSQASERSTADTRTRRRVYGRYIGLALIVMIIGACVIGGQAYARVAETLQEISSGEEVRPASRRLTTPPHNPSSRQQSEQAAPEDDGQELAHASPPPAPTANPAEQPQPSPLAQRPFTVLLVGTDVRDDPREPAVRSDTLILAHVDPQAGWASMLSIPRDTLVTIPSDVCSGQRKINAAYACGYLHPTQYGPKVKPEDAGAALAAETVEAFLGIPVDYTAQVDFRGFERVIDAIGGITIDVPRTIVDPAYPTEDYGTIELVFKAGKQRMDGETALQYARTRHADSDFGRIDRQQQVLMAVLQKFRDRGLLAQIGSASRLLDIVSDSVRTTLPLDDLNTVYALATVADEIGVENIRRLALHPEQDRSGASNLRMAQDSAIVWKPAYIERVVDEFLTPPTSLASAR